MVFISVKPQNKSGFHGKTDMPVVNTLMGLGSCSEKRFFGMLACTVHMANRSAAEVILSGVERDSRQGGSEPIQIGKVGIFQIDLDRSEIARTFP
ncbi:MAG: hypothetical protein ACLTK0_08605 [Anaerovoracaceae bacterium]